MRKILAVAALTATTLGGLAAGAGAANATPSCPQGPCGDPVNSLEKTITSDVHGVVGSIGYLGSDYMSRPSYQ